MRIDCKELLTASLRGCWCDEELLALRLLLLRDFCYRWLCALAPARLTVRVVMGDALGPVTMRPAVGEMSLDRPLPREN